MTIAAHKALLSAPITITASVETATAVPAGATEPMFRTPCPSWRRGHHCGRCATPWSENIQNVEDMNETSAAMIFGTYSAQRPASGQR
jgi:hypothetical protein